MHEGILSPLRAWESFYVIVGSAGGALTGLQFVVLTLIGESSRVRSNQDTLSAFGTPNVVHFCAALLVSCVLSAPWTSLGQAGTAVAICGALGVVYAVRVLRRTVRQSIYRPVLEDWVWHITLPMLSYATILVSGAFLARNPVATLFLLGGATLLLVFIGIHNAWDTVTFITTVRAEASPDSAARPKPGAPSPAPPKGTPLL
jgi:hypothetical protein